MDRTSAPDAQPRGAAAAIQQPAVTLSPATIRADEGNRSVTATDRADSQPRYRMAADVELVFSSSAGQLR